MTAGSDRQLKNRILAAGHDHAASLLACAVDDGIITDAQRIALLENWLPWGDRPGTARSWQSEDDAQRIRDDQGRNA